MILTRAQEQALKIAVDRWHNNEKYVVISGYRGTGKTTLIRFIIDALDVSENKVCYSAYTGKAVEVLRSKGNKNCMTLHKLLYESIPRAGGGFFHKPKVTLGYSVVVVDEVSMRPKELMDQLFSHKVFVICCGDPAQLPPVDRDTDNHLLDEPDVFLDEIMRQAQESEIIRLTMKIRNHEEIDYSNGLEVQVIPKKQLNTGMLLWADQVLTATNNTRLKINQQMRSLLGRGELPEEGDKVICLRNYWDDLDSKGDALTNGTIGYLKNPFITFREAPKFVKGLQRRTYPIVQGDIIIDEDNHFFPQVEIDKEMLLTGEKCVDWRDAYKLGKLKMRYGEIIPKEFAYGYAITRHKSQGSSWEKILVLEESFPFDREEHARWLYTAATRASEKLVIVR